MVSKVRALESAGVFGLKLKFRGFGCYCFLWVQRLYSEFRPLKHSLWLLNSVRLSCRCARNSERNLFKKVASPGFETYNTKPINPNSLAQNPRKYKSKLSESTTL